MTSSISSRFCHNVFDASLLTIFPSDVESLRKGIIKTSKNKVQADYTILLVGETGIGKSTFLEFLANVLIGNNIDHYSYMIDSDHGPNDFSYQSQTNSARLYKLTSNNGIVVSADASKVSMCNLFPRFASSTHLGWPTLAVSSKTNSTGRISLLRSRITLTPSLPSSSSSMAPSRGLLFVPTMHCPLCSLCSLNP